MYIIGSYSFLSYTNVYYTILSTGWVTGARVTLPAMCRGVGQARWASLSYHSASVDPAMMGT